PTGSFLESGIEPMTFFMKNTGMSLCKRTCCVSMWPFRATATKKCMYSIRCGKIERIFGGCCKMEPEYMSQAMRSAWQKMSINAFRTLWQIRLEFHKITQGSILQTYATKSDTFATFIKGSLGIKFYTF